MATYNGSRFIEEQFKSLAAQKGVDIHVLASDDGSNDGTVELSLEVAEKLGVALDFLPMRAPSGSSSNNFYRLLRDANFDAYDYVAFCDQDDIWLEDKVRRATEVLQQSGAGAYSCNSIAFWPDGKERRIRKNFPQRSRDYLFESASQGCTYVITQACAREFQRFIRAQSTGVNSILFHDWLLYAWARHSGVHWIMDDQYLVRYRQSGINVIGANFGLAATLSRIKKLRDGWFRNQSLQIISILGLRDDPIAISLQRYRTIDRVRLALRARQCRRRTRDAVVLFLACLLFGAA